MSYRQILAAPSVRNWAVVTAGTRLAVTTVPLASVLLAAAVLHSYAIGGFLAGGYAAGEALLAPIMGRRAQRRPLRRELALTIAAEAIFIVLTLTVIASAAHWWPLAIATLAAAGGAASGVPGALRSYIATAVRPVMRDRALGIDTIISQASWLLGPSLAAIAATTVNPWAPLMIVAAGLVLTLPAVITLSEAPRRSYTSDSDQHSALKLARTLVIPVVASALIMATLAALDVLIPAYTAAHGAPQILSGGTLAGLAALSMTCSAVYGARRWPGSPSTHSQAGILAMGGLMVTIGLSGGPLWMGLGLCVLAGAAEAPALLGRNIALTENLPEREWTVGFSLLYSAGGIGYTVGSTVAGQLLEHTTTAAAFAIIGASVAALGSVSLALERQSKCHSQGIANVSGTTQTPSTQTHN